MSTESIYPYRSDNLEHSRLYELAHKIKRNPGVILRTPNKIRDYIGWPKVYEHLDQFCNDLTRPFKFIEIGANDGIRNDPIYSRVVENGWHGVLVEPEPVQFAALVENYVDCPNLEFVHAAITPADGTVSLKRFDPKATGGLGVESSSVSKEVLEKSARLLGLKNIEGFTDEIVVPSMKLETLIETTGLYDPDLVVIDAEGSDASIVRDLLQTKISPTFVLYEHLMMGKAEKIQIQKEFKAQGYGQIALGQDSFAYKKQGILY